MESLTRRQQQCLDFVATHIAAFSRPPSLREIMAHMGIRSTNGVADHLTALERKGCVKTERFATCCNVMLTPLGIIKSTSVTSCQHCGKPRLLQPTNSQEGDEVR